MAVSDDGVGGTGRLPYSWPAVDRVLLRKLGFGGHHIGFEAVLFNVFVRFLVGIACFAGRVAPREASRTSPNLQ
jgi:hypothetical protein